MSHILHRCMHLRSLYGRDFLKIPGFVYKIKESTQRVEMNTDPCLSDKGSLRISVSYLIPGMKDTPSIASFQSLSGISAHPESIFGCEIRLTTVY